MLDSSHDPRTGAVTASMPATAPDEVAEVLDRALAAFAVMRTSSPAERSRWLEAIAAELVDEEEALAACADRETALGIPRLTEEVRRTAAQLRFYAETALDGGYLAAEISTASSLRRIAAPVGPVAVFGASNFPFAFGAIGNDSASAIAAGCPVVAKAHPAHLGTSALIEEVVQRALRRAGAPQGAFQLISGYDSGVALVEHPAVAAVAFTGSESGGMSLWRRANQRPIPVPVYAEMGTVNTVVVLAGAAARRAEIAAGFIASFTGGHGQLCTKPGLLLVPSGAGFPTAVADALRATAPHSTMLTRAIADGVRRGVADLQSAGASVLAITADGGPGWSAPAAVLSASTRDLVPGSRLLGEVFGPVALVVEYDDSEDLIATVSRLPGALAAGLFADDTDPDAPAVVESLQARVGRLVMNGWTTGVVVDRAQHHGGPWPATSDPRATSVGAAALSRFVRPVAFQGVADRLLPPGLRDANPWEIRRAIDGVVEPPGLPGGP